MLCRRQTARLMLSVSHGQTEHLYLLLSSMCARAYHLSADATLLLHSFFINSHRVTVFYVCYTSHSHTAFMRNLLTSKVSQHFFKQLFCDFKEVHMSRH